MKKLALFTFVVLLLAAAQTVRAQSAGFTYQGSLSDGVTGASGTYQMQFALFDAVSGGAQQGSTITNNSVSVVNGVFTVQLNFTSAPFSAGGNRWLEISVKKPADASFVTLSPRQPLSTSPYAIRTLSAGTSDSLSASCVQCVTDTQIAGVSGSKISGQVPTATNASLASTAGNVTGVVNVLNGGTGSSTQNFVDLSTTQSILGTKTFSNNVSVAGTLTATLGQSVPTAFNTAVLNVTNSTLFTLVPGLTQTINVPANYSVYLVSNGGISTVSNSSTGFSTVDVALFIDSSFTPNGGYERVVAANNPGLGTTNRYWKINYAGPIAAGSHTFEVRVQYVAGSDATVGGNNSSVLQGSLTVILIRN